ncbi:nicotinamidase [Lentisalinibacter sediminis]|uniref:nicotinamidase n=1 Tax=Lentisalinibacter sediminis TaxID=2992237 RepID=UPI003868AECE
MAPRDALLKPHKGDALILVDVQNDFLPGGALGVPEGDEVIPVLNKYSELFENLGLPIVATRDWHPEDHCSFEAQGGPWPPHCVAGTKGAAFATDLDLHGDTKVISKAETPDEEAYSGFQGTGLNQWLKERGVKRVFVGGLATDYCVRETVRDGLVNGYEVVLLEDAVRAVNVEPDDGEKAVTAMEKDGAVKTDFEHLEAA